MLNVDDPHRKSLDHLLAQDLYVAGHDHQVDLKFAKQLDFPG